MENHTPFTTHIPNRLDILNHAYFVIHKHDRHKYGIATKGVFESVQIDQAVLLDIEIADFKALALKFAHGIERGLVFGFNGDQMLSAFLIKPCRAFDGQVDRLRGTRSPHQFFRITTNKRSNIFSCLFHRLLGMPSVGMRARGGVTESITQKGDHLVYDARINRRRGGIVKINW